ncbi:HEAT repeat domain-containing protein [Marinicella litoralis]|uniref:HEAT repeat protein n=1 Tax=Marinicella litoralis TaxID=644220 RepID=A0A4R6XRQ2_9GAMM|nr:HEAT repeat domain-containing protein [Marinicella litoralis]TDR22585.1 HEAT repeat protein [Marinicella litoralis]
MSPKDISHKELELMMMDYISGRMNHDEASSFNQLIAENPEYSQELVELKQMMELFAQHDGADIPEPSDQMDQNFYTMLHAEVAADSNSHKGFWQNLVAWFQLPQVRKFSYAFSFMVVGVFLGHYMHLLNTQTALANERMVIKDQQIQALTVLSLLDMPSANKRLVAVNLVSMTEQPNEAMIDALLRTLKQDNNINVRLEALDVLAQHTENHVVRAGLVSAIAYQESPMVQFAIANLMQAMGEQEAVEPMQKLLEHDELIAPVRSKFNETISELI